MYVIFYLCDSVSGKNTQFPGLLTGLRQEGHPAVKPSASIKSCKMSNNVMSYTRAISTRDGVVPGKEKVRCGHIQTSHHIKNVKYVNYVYPHGLCPRITLERLLSQVNFSKRFSI